MKKSKNFKKWLLLPLVIIPTSFVLVSCSPIDINMKAEQIKADQKAKLKSFYEFNNYDSAILLYEGFLLQNEWNQKIESVEQLNIFVDKMIANYDKWLENIKYYGSAEENLVYKNYDQDAKVNFEKYWNLLKRKYNDDFFSKSSLLVNPPKENTDLVDIKINGKWNGLQLVEPYFNNAYFETENEINLPYFWTYYTGMSVEHNNHSPSLDNLHLYYEDAALNKSSNKIEIYPSKAKWHDYIVPNDDQDQNIPAPQWIRPQWIYQRHGILFVEIPKSNTEIDYSFKVKYFLNDFFDKFIKNK